MSHPYFAGIEKISFEGPASDNPLALRYYQPERVVMGKKMVDWLKPAVAYWHSFAWPGSDMFGPGTLARPWQAADDRAHAQNKLTVAFEFFEKLGLPYYCFHDVDAVPLGEDLQTAESNLSWMADLMAAEIERTGIGLLWGTANLFSHPRYMSGAATNPDPEVFAYAAGQVRAMLETTHRLGGLNYVLWGGREGYETILNTEMKRELDQMGRFLSMVVEHKEKIGFKGAILIEPKPCEPTKHQYDHDVATVYGFLTAYGLEKEVKCNIEANHATLAGHSFEHEIALAAGLGMLGGIDANRGDPQNGWDTDQFPNNVPELTLAMIHLLQSGGMGNGGFNFDAKIRRQSIDPADLFHAHIGGIDVLARSLLAAASILEEGTLPDFVAARYAGWDTGLGAAIGGGEHSLASLADLARDTGIAPKPVSGRQEYLENIVNRHV